MIIKKYIVDDMLEANMKIKADLGENAIILYTRKFKDRGLKGLFHPPKIEVIATVDNKLDSMQVLKKDIEIIKQKLYTKENNSSSDTIYDKMLELGFNPYIAKKILASHGDILTLDDLRSLFIKKLGFPIPLKLESKPTSVIFMGITGVGKTTTIAKMAANYVLNFHKDIAFITADTFRIAAVEQLKTYANMLNVPIKVVKNNFELSLAIKAFSDKDIIFIDTAGRNHNNKYQMQNLKDLVKNVRIDEAYLVLNAASNYNDINKILKEFSFLKYKIIFSKLDEASTLSSILETRYLTDAPFSYVTIGQNVPDDIEILNPIKVVENVFGGA